jgi:glutamate/tyrosine decarboxylase-like PLP-dependent enzyme
MNHAYISSMPQNPIQPKPCSPEEVALKSFFLGPQSENAPWLRELVVQVLDNWFAWRRLLYPGDGRAISVSDQESVRFLAKREDFSTRIHELMQRFQNEVPSFSPRYIGHMITEVSMPALLGHIITVLHNPNNISGEASRVGIEIEEEAIHELMKMVRYRPEEGNGHFTSGGTLANLESCLRARGRMAKWLAAGAAARAAGSDISLMEAAHMGWEKYDRLRVDARVDDDLLVRYNFLKSGALRTVREYEKLFGFPYEGTVALVPNNKHYSWNKSLDIMGMGEEAFRGVSTDRNGRLSITGLEKALDRALGEKRPVLMVVSIAGTTELGDFDPIHEVQHVLDTWRQRHGLHIWHHIDAAYGGFFCTLDIDKKDLISESMTEALKSMHKANSITIDPHKLGYVPYSSGAILCKSKREYFYKKTHAPYINFRDAEDRGPQTVEGSRSAAGAVSTWLTARSIGLNRHGYGIILERTIRSRMKLESLFAEASDRLRVNRHAETNVLCFCVADKGDALSTVNRRTQAIYEAFSPDENHDFFVSKTTLNRSDYNAFMDDFTSGWDAVTDTGDLSLIRLVLMNPFFDNRETDVHYPEEFVKKLMQFLETLE